MKQKISDTIAEKFIAEGIIQEEDKAIYAYGWRALGMWCLCTSIMFLIGIVMGEFVFTMIYFLSFSLLRAYYEGYHANSRMVCFFTSMLLFIASVLAAKYVVWDANHLLLLVVLLILCICMNMIKVAEFQKADKLQMVEPFEKRKLFVGVIMMFLMLLIFMGMLKIQFTKGYAGVFVAFILTFLLFSMKRIVNFVKKDRSEA